MSNLSNFAFCHSYSVPPRTFDCLSNELRSIATIHHALNTPNESIRPMIDAVKNASTKDLYLSMPQLMFSIKEVFELVENRYLNSNNTKLATLLDLIAKRACNNTIKACQLLQKKPLNTELYQEVEDIISIFLELEYLVKQNVFSNSDLISETQKEISLLFETMEKMKHVYECAKEFSTDIETQKTKAEEKVLKDLSNSELYFNFQELATRIYSPLNTSWVRDLAIQTEKSKEVLNTDITPQLSKEMDEMRDEYVKSMYSLDLALQYGIVSEIYALFISLDMEMFLLAAQVDVNLLKKYNNKKALLEENLQNAKERTYLNNSRKNVKQAQDELTQFVQNKESYIKVLSEEQDKKEDQIFYGIVIQSEISDLILSMKEKLTNFKPKCQKERFKLKTEIDNKNKSVLFTSQERVILGMNDCICSKDDLNERQMTFFIMSQNTFKKLDEHDKLTPLSVWEKIGIEAKKTNAKNISAFIMELKNNNFAQNYAFGRNNLNIIFC